MIDNSVVSVEPAEAEALLRAAAASGDLDAMTALGCWQELHGEDAEAVQLYEEAARRGHAGAARQMWLRGVRKGKLATDSYRRAAAEGGDEIAARYSKLEHHQAVELSRGISGPLYRYLSGWYERAAQAGDAGAMRKLGRLASVRGDRFAAADWFSRAAEASGGVVDPWGYPLASKKVSKAFDQAPPDVRAVAEEHGIASRYFMYEVGLKDAGGAWLGAVLGVAFAAFWVLIGGSMAADGEGLGVFVIIVALFCAGAVIVHAASVGSSVDDRVYLFEGGFVRTGKAEAAQAFRWDQIAVWHFIWSTQAGPGLGNVSTSYKYTIVRSDGARLVLESDKFPGVAEFGPEIQKRLTEARYPGTIEAIRAGQTIDFGPIKVDANGVSTSDGTTPWDQVEKVSYKDGCVHIKPVGGKKWMAGVSTIPNFFVFVEVVDALWQTRAERS